MPAKSLQSCLSVTPWTVACQAPLSVRFSRQEDWSGLPFPFPGDLPNPGLKPASFMFPALVGEFITAESPGKPSEAVGGCPALHTAPSSQRTALPSSAWCAGPRVGWLCAEPGHMPPARGVSPNEEVRGGREQAPGHMRGLQQLRWPALTDCKSGGNPCR